MRAIPSITFVLLLTQIAACPPPPTDPTALAAARVIEVQGEVLQDGRRLAPGDQVALATEIEVKSGRLVLELPGKGQLRLFANSRVRLLDANRLRLLVGRVWALIDAAVGARYEVETDNAVAGVRGTEFIVAASAERTEVAVLAGVVEVKHKQHAAPPTTVHPGQKTVVAAAEPPAPPVAYDPSSDRQQWEEPLPEPSTPAAAPEGLPPPPVVPPPPIQRPPDKAPLSPLEREGERTKQELHRESERTRQDLKREETDTRRRLEETEATTKQQLEDEARQIREGHEPKGKDSVKDFLK